MPENSHPSNPPHAGAEKTIVLLLPQALGDEVNAAQLRETLKTSPNVRVLLCLTDPSGKAADTRMDTSVKALKGAIAELAELDCKVEVQILRGAQVKEPDIHPDVILRIPAGAFADPKIAVNDQTEFALALSDIVLLGPVSGEPDDELRQFFAHVRKLEKLTVRPGEPLPALPSVADVTSGLDPDRPGWSGRARRFFLVGRIEQFVLELFAFNWLGSDKGGRAESRKRLRRCCSRKWRPGAYFAPDGWQDRAPDSEAGPRSGIIACFNLLDRSALYGSHKHRDFVWMEYLGAATAVLIAVAGHVFHFGILSGVLELIALLFVAALVLWSRSTHLQDQWTACRLGAEQLRIALMSLPLLVLPKALATADKQPVPEDDEDEDDRVNFGFKALQLVKRAVRQHGLPRLDGAFSPGEAAGWLRLILEDQIRYHDSNSRKLKHAERRLQLIARLIFLAAIVAVLVHFCNHADWLLLVTAAAPAYAAALHEIGTHLGIVHRTALSFEMKNELKRIATDLGDLGRPEDQWKKVRHLAYEATEIMSSENKSWHGLVRRYRDDL